MRPEGLPPLEPDITFPAGEGSGGHHELSHDSDWFGSSGQGSFSQLTRDRMATSGGASAGEGNPNVEEGRHGVGTRLSLFENLLEGEVEEAATEMVRQTSVSHHQRDLAELFLRGESQTFRQEPEYFQIGSPRSSSPVDPGTGRAAGEQGLLQPSDQSGMTARSLGPEGSQAGSSQLALGVAGLSLNERVSGAHGANERPRAMVPVTAAGLETMPAREIYNALEGTGSENSLFLALVQRLERAEARSRSTTEVGVGVHSGTEGLSGPPNFVHRGEGPGRWQVGSCLGPTTNLRECRLRKFHRFCLHLLSWAVGLFRAKPTPGATY